LADLNCWAANRGWHETHKKRVVDFGGNPHVVCDDCLAVATISDTWLDSDELEVRGGHAVALLGEKGWDDTQLWLQKYGGVKR